MSPSKPKTTPSTLPSSDVTPEMALKALKDIVAADPFASGARMHACRIAGQRLAKAMAEVQAAEEHAAQLRASITTLVSEALAAVSGTATLGKAPGKATKATNGQAPGTAEGGVA